MNAHDIITFALGIILGYIVAGLSNFFHLLYSAATRRRDEALQLLKDIEPKLDEATQLLKDQNEALVRSTEIIRELEEALTTSDWEDETEDVPKRKCVFCDDDATHSMHGVFICQKHADEHSKFCCEKKPWKVCDCET